MIVPAPESDDKRAHRSFVLRLIFWLLAGVGVGAVMFLMLGLLLMGRGTVSELPICSSSVAHEMTGDLATDLVGAWRRPTREGGWHHPIAYMAGQGEENDPKQSNWTGGRIWMFRPDGSGHVWWVYNEVGCGSYENDEEFVWEVVEEKLIVNDLPPAELEPWGEETFRLIPSEDTVDPSRGLSMRACDLDLPDEVKGFD